MLTVWTTWIGCDGLLAFHVRDAVILGGGGLAMGASSALDAALVHR
jgi:hypothetical protein